MFGSKKRNASTFILKGMLIFGILGVLVLGTSSMVLAKAKEHPHDKLRKEFLKATQGKTVVFTRFWAGVLEREFTNVMRQNFERYGMKFILRDSDGKADVQRQALESIMLQKPDVIVVQSVNQTNTARLIKKAMAQGIFVVELNMPSVQVSDGYVGIDNSQVGRTIAQDIIKEIGGGKTSGEVMILEGDPAAPYSFEQAEAAVEEFKKDPSIKVVARQASFWDPNKGNEIIATVIQSHPNLAAVYSIWGPQAAGVGQALKNAGSKAKIWVASDGQMPDCELLKQGAFHKILSYRADVLAEDAVSMVLQMLQDKDKIKPGEKQIAHYTALYWVTGPDDIPYSCWPMIEDSRK